MGTIILYNIDLLAGIILLLWIMKKNRQSKMRKTGKVVIHIAGILGIAALLGILVFIDFIALGVIGPVPN